MFPKNEDKGNVITGVYTRNIIQCSKCDKVMKENEENNYECPNCHRLYIPQREPLKYEDEMVSSHEDENVELGGLDSGSGLAIEPDDDLMKLKLGPETQTKINLRPGENLVSYDEEIPDPN